MKFSALAIAGFISLVSAQAESTVVVHATYTDVVYSTQIKTITSCSDGKCNKHVTSEVVSQPTAYANPSDFNVDSSIQTITVTSCKDNKCSEKITTTTIPCSPTATSIEAIVETESCTESLGGAISSPVPSKISTVTEECQDCHKASFVSGHPAESGSLFPVNSGSAPPMESGSVPPKPISSGSVPPKPVSSDSVPPMFSGSIPPKPVSSGSVPPKPMESGSVPPKPISSGSVPPTFSGSVPPKPISSSSISPMESAPAISRKVQCPAPVTVTVTISVPNCAVEPTSLYSKSFAAVESTFSTAIPSTLAIRI